MSDNSFNYTLLPEDFMVNCVWSLPIHGRAALGGKISCATTIATSLKNTVVLLHGPIGCAFQRRINPCRGWNPIYDMPCTALTEAETVYGAYDRLLGALDEVYDKYKPELILVISSDVADQIGDYMDAVREETKVQCEVVVSSLVSCEQDSVMTKRGFSIIRNALITQLLENVDCEVQDEKAINIATLVQFPDEGQRNRELRSLIQNMGLHVNGSYFYNNSVDDIKRMPRALASVVHYASETWTEFLKKNYGMKYIELYPEPRYSSIEYGPYGFDGVDKLLMDIGKVYNIEGDAEEVAKRSRGKAEEALATHLPALKGKTLSVVGSYTGGYAADLLRYCGMKCELLILRFRTGTNFDMLLNDEAKERTAEMWHEFCLKYDSDPEILIEPTPGEELKALKRCRPDLVVPPALASASAWWYEKNGFKTLVPNRLSGYFFRLGYWAVVDAAIEARRALERPCSSKPLLAMVDQDEEYGGLTKYWADRARVFRHMWYETT